MIHVCGDEYLAHYGVKGMKWGVRNDYVPVGRSSGQSLRTPTSKTSFGKSAAMKMLGGIRSSAKSIKSKGLIRSTAVLQSGGGMSSKNIKMNTSTTKGINAVSAFSSNATNGPVKTTLKNGVQIKECSTSKAEDLKLINPTLDISEKVKDAVYNEGSLKGLTKAEQKEYINAAKTGSANNCTFCTQTAVLRSMGYDVQANVTTRNRSPLDQLRYWPGSEFENMAGTKLTNPKDMKAFTKSLWSRPASKISREQEISNLSSRLESMGEGAKGNLCVIGSFGHSVEFRVESGKARVYDNQCGRRYDSVNDFFSTCKHYNPSFSYYSRLDNCQPDLDLMMKEKVIKAR